MRSQERVKMLRSIVLFLACRLLHGGGVALREGGEQEGKSRLTKEEEGRGLGPR